MTSKPAWPHKGQEIVSKSEASNYIVSQDLPMKPIAFHRGAGEENGYTERCSQQVSLWSGRWAKTPRRRTPPGKRTPGGNMLRALLVPLSTTACSGGTSFPIRL